MIKNLRIRSDTYACPGKRQYDRILERDQHRFEAGGTKIFGDISLGSVMVGEIQTGVRAGPPLR